jgi:hypothetical protein
MDMTQNRKIKKTRTAVFLQINERNISVFHVRYSANIWNNLMLNSRSTFTTLRYAPIGFIISILHSLLETILCSLLKDFISAGSLELTILRLRGT